MRVLVVVAMAAVVLAGCHARNAVSGPDSRGPGPAPACATSLGGRMVALDGALTADVVGASGPAIVLSNQSDENLCGWIKMAAALKTAGWRVVLYDYASGPTDDLPVIVQWLRAHGSAKVALMGASQGAKGTIIAAAGITPAVSAVVSLSAEASLDGTDVATYAAKLRVPTLFVTASADPYQSTAATTGFYKSSPATVKKLITVPGAAHGTALLTTSVVGQIVAFLKPYA